MPSGEDLRSDCAAPGGTSELEIALPQPCGSIDHPTALNTRERARAWLQPIEGTRHGR